MSFYDTDNTSVPGHDRKCDCYLCESARTVPEAICPDVFSIRRSRENPVYIIEFMRSDTDENVRVMFTPQMLANIGTSCIEVSMDDCANALTHDEGGDIPGWKLPD
jgi:hypothetical protein